MTILTNIAKSLFELSGEDYASKKYLLAVSGGVDSMVMLDVFSELKLDFEVTHCNYHLRGEDSKRDAELVHAVCDEKGITCHIKCFDTNKIIEEKGGSIQEVARELRYTWFGELMPNFDHLVTAHHLNDNIETFFINLSRGSGLKGLSGIPSRNKSTIRPFLKTSKQDFLAYAEEQDLEWREDESNSSNKYVRNVYRNQILPAIKETKPKFDSVMTSNLERIRKSKDLLDYFIEEVKSTLVEKVGGKTKIAIDKLKKYPSKEIILYEMLHQFGFNYDQAESMLGVVESGKTFLSEKFKAVIYRGELQVEELEEKQFDEITFTNVEDMKASEYFSEVETLNNLPELKTGKNTAYIDLADINFPLILTKVTRDSEFKPLGMKNFKKVFDFLHNEKLSTFEREQVLILKNHFGIIWVVSHRLDDRYKITSDTKSILKLVTK